MRTDHRLDALYREHADQLWRGVYAYVADRDIASDAVAEAFAQCLRRGDAVRSPRRWLWTTAFRVAAGEMKRRGGLSELRDDRTYETPDRAWALVAALRTLPERQRAAVVLHYYAGYSTAEIGRIVGSSGATVRVHLSRARKRLRDLLEEEDV